MHDTTVTVWDLPLRAFHWLLVLAVIIAYLSVRTGWLDTDVHWYAGTMVTFLWFFRLVWGFAGTATARFSQFFPTPRKLSQYLRNGWQGLGHTPTGGLSVIALLLLLAAMIATGIFANDDITLQGPLAKYVDESFSDQMSTWHAYLFNVLLGLVTLHLLAILYYFIFKKNDLLGPMISGKKTVPPSLLTALPPSTIKLWWRFLASLLIASLVTFGLFSSSAHYFFYQPPSATTTPASSHAW